MSLPSTDWVPSVKVEFIGQEREPVVVVDHCAPDPDALVREAASRDYQPLGAFYPGLRAHAPKAYFESLGPLLAKVTREVFGYRRELKLVRALYSLVATPPADLSLAQRIPHVDTVDDGMIAMLHFLTQEDFGGTSFYRHRATGFETIDHQRHRPYLDALRADFDRHGEPPPGYIAGDTEIFERIAYVPPAYNRALIYRSGLLHCAAVDPRAPLSANPQTGRLTIASFMAAR
jgi:hypothetical protein